MYSGYNVLLFMPLGKQRNNLRFSKYSAGAIDSQGLIPGKSVQFSHLINIYFQIPGSHLKEPARACCSFIIHNEILDKTLLIDQDNF